MLLPDLHELLEEIGQCLGQGNDPLLPPLPHDPQMGDFPKNDSIHPESGRLRDPKARSEKKPKNCPDPAIFPRFSVRQKFQKKFRFLFREDVRKFSPGSPLLHRKKRGCRIAVDQSDLGQMRQNGRKLSGVYPSRILRFRDMKDEFSENGIVETFERNPVVPQKFDEFFENGPISRLGPSRVVRIGKPFLEGLPRGLPPFFRVVDPVAHQPGSLCSVRESIL